jgi:hypothetical protein
MNMDEHDDDVGPEVEDGVDFEVEDFPVLDEEEDDESESEDAEADPDIDPDKSEI